MYGYKFIERIPLTASLGTALAPVTALALPLMVVCSTTPAPNHNRTHTSLGREDAPPSWHTVFSFNPNTSQYLVNLPKGSLVYVEGSLGYRDIEGSVGQQAVIRHGMCRVKR
jgi:single-stranded DNA-binding protein